MEEENKINLSEPPTYHSYESNALYYRSKVDNKEYIVLIQSQCPNERICQYDVENDQYIPISPDDGLRHYTSKQMLFPFKSPKLAQIITDTANNDQLLTMCTNKNHLAAFNLITSQYTNNYQSTYNPVVDTNNNRNNHSLSSYILQSMLIIILFTIFLCNNSIPIAAIYGVLLYLLSIKIANFAFKFEKDVKCVIPDFELLYNITSCIIDGDGIHFMANNYEQNKTTLNHFKFDLKSRQFIKLKSIDFGKDLDTKNNGEYGTETANIQKMKAIKAYKMVYIKSMETLIMFTDTENIYYYDLKDEEKPQWRIYEDVKLPKVPSIDCDINIVVGFEGIIFLFYYDKHSHSHSIQNRDRVERIPSEESDSDTDCDSDDVYTYCWDLLLTGNIFECDNKYPSFNGHHCIAVNTDNNWTHFIGENPLPFHFKISLTEEIPVEITIIHLQYYHSLIKQYISLVTKHIISTDVEMLILDYFPMFL